MDSELKGLGWWTISGEALLEALKAVAEGDDPDVVYAELCQFGEVGKAPDDLLDQ